MSRNNEIDSFGEKIPQSVDCSIGFSLIFSSRRRHSPNHSHVNYCYIKPWMNMHKISFRMNLLFDNFQKVQFALKTDKDSSVIRYCNISLRFTSPLCSTLSITAAKLFIIAVTSLSLAD